LLDEVGAKFELPFKILARQGYPPAWGSCFFQVFAIGRADSEAQSASDAIEILGFLGFNQIRHSLPLSGHGFSQSCTDVSKSAQICENQRPVCTTIFPELPGVSEAHAVRSKHHRTSPCL
jgi:hypothetical protein